MTFACLSQATATSARVFHHTQNTFVTNEIHNQGNIVFVTQILHKNLQNILLIIADSSFCWAFALSTMIRHSVHFFLGQLAKEQPLRFESEKIYQATKFLNDPGFHKRLRIGYRDSIFFIFLRYFLT